MVHPAIVTLANRVAKSATEGVRIRFEDMMERGCFEKTITWEEFVDCCPRTDFLCIDHIFHVLDMKGIAPISEHRKIPERAMKLAIHTAMEHKLYCLGGTNHTGPMSSCDDPYAIPAYQGITKDEFYAIKERRFG